MTIHPLPYQEAAIQEAIKAGLINNEFDIIEAGINAIFSTRKEQPVNEVIDRLASFGKRHKLSLGENLAIKDLINEGRK